MTSLSSGGRTAYINAQETLREGLEVSARHFFNNQWRALLTATAIQAEFGGSTSLAGKTLPGIPRQQLFSSLSWFEKGFQNKGNKPLHGKEASFEWVMRSKLWASESNEIASLAPGYGVFNARFKQHLSMAQFHLEMFAGIDNVMDKKAVGSVIINQFNKQYFEPALPRNWTIGLSATMPL